MFGLSIFDVLIRLEWIYPATTLFVSKISNHIGCNGMGVFRMQLWNFRILEIEFMFMCFFFCLKYGAYTQ